MRNADKVQVKISELVKPHVNESRCSQKMYKLKSTQTNKKTYSAN
jgi:hypothetical protein